MAIAVNGGHVSRAIDFYNKEDKYFIIGGSQPWSNEPTPDVPSSGDFRLRDVIGLKKIENTFLVVPDNERGTISYRDQKWKVVAEEFEATVTNEPIPEGENTFTISNITGLAIGNKLRINNLYEGTITNITGLSITLDTSAPTTIMVNSKVLGGALVENAKYVYVDAYLEYDKFPLATYRQIGLCTQVEADPTLESDDILRSAAYNPAEVDEFVSLGVLEIIDNRSPIPRDINMREMLSMIVEM